MSNNSNSELIYITSLFHPEVNKGCSSFINDIKWSTSLGKMLMPMISEIHAWSDITIQSSLTNVLIPEELDQLIKSVETTRSKVTDPLEVKTLVTNLFSYYRKREINHILSDERNLSNIENLISQVKDIPDSAAPAIQSYNLGDLDPETVMEEEIGDVDFVLPTSLEVVKKSTEPYRGYLPGTLTQICSPPGTGKTTLMYSEAVLAALEGYRVLYVALGDMFKFDFMSKGVSILKKLGISEAIAGLTHHYTADIRTVLSNIQIVTEAAGVVSMADIENIAERDGPFAMVVIDYDSNLYESSSGDNMYHTGGEIYNHATRIARPKNQRPRAVLIASQPKIQYWEEEIIPLAGAAESARKQHTIDLMITMSKIEGQRPMGNIHIAKARRGLLGSIQPYYLTDHSTLKECSSQEFAMLRIQR